MHGFTEVPQGSHVDTELDFMILNDMSAILGQRNKVVAVKCIKPDSDFFIAMPDTDDVQRAAVGPGIPNPGSCQRLGDKLLDVGFSHITPDDGNWGEIQQDPLCRMSALVNSSLSALSSM